jgi:hypothetical protein
MKVILDIYNERMQFQLVSEPFEWIFPKYPEKNDMIIPSQFSEIAIFNFFDCEDDCITEDYHYFRNSEFNIINGEPIITFQFYDEKQ